MAIARWRAGLTPAMMHQIEEWRSLPDHPHYARGQMTLSSRKIRTLRTESYDQALPENVIQALLLTSAPVTAGHLLNVRFLEARQGPQMAQRRL